MKEANKDKWIHLLMDADLTDQQRAELEKRLESSRDFECEKIIRDYLHEMGKEYPAADQPDFMWSKIKERIQKEPSREPRRSQSIFGLPKWSWAFASSILVALGIMVLWPAKEVKKEVQTSTYGQIHGVNTFSTDVSATAYESTSGNATVLWVNGFEKDNPSSSFGEIWEVHSYKPEVTATAYESRSANATVIWISGMDDTATF
jgi:hypothetical protein